MAENLETQAKQADAAIQEFVNAIRVTGDDPAAIFDGLSYALPALLPPTLRESLSRNNQLEGFIRESWSTALGKPTGLPYGFDQSLGDIYENPLEEWNWTTRYYIAEQVHALYHRSPDARAVDHIANFAVGEGFQLLTYNPAVEDALQEFIDHPFNALREYETQAAIDLLIDGELILQWLPPQAGIPPTVVPVRPWELVTIEHELGNPRAIVSYVFYRDETTDSEYGVSRFRKETLPADEITFVKINSHAYETRGRSELYAVIPWIKARKEWLENRARVNHWLSILLWRVKVDTTNQKAFEAVKQRWQSPPKPNSISVENSMVDVEPISASPRAGEVKDDGHQLLLQIAKGLHLPEYFLSDGQNSNLATATRQQLPALIKFEKLQRVLIRQLWQPLFKKALEIEVNAGRLPEELDKFNSAGDPVAGERIATVEAFDVSYKPIVHDDMVSLTAALEKQVANEFISIREARLRLGGDPDRIEKELDEEREAKMAGIDAGRFFSPPVQRDVDEYDAEIEF